MLEYRLQQEDYRMKTLRTIYPYEVNEKTKVMNKNVPVGKLFPPLSRDRERFLSGRTGNDIDK